MGDCEQSIKGRYRGTSKAGPNSLCSVSLWTGSLFGEKKTRKGKGKASVTGWCSVIGSVFRTTDHTECLENGAKCTLGTRDFSREQRGASRVSLFKTWPKPETAHEKPLAPSVRETGIRWKKNRKRGEKEGDRRNLRTILASRTTWTNSREGKQDLACCRSGSAI